MKKYTIIYQNGHIVSLQYLKCEPSAILEEIGKWTDVTNVWFLLDGHCKQTKD